MLLLSVLWCVPPTIAAEPQRVTVNVENATLRQLFKQIEKQTTYHFSYDNGAVADTKDVTIDLASQPVDKVLDAALKNSGLQYRILSDNTIVISQKEKKTATEPGAMVRTTGTVTDDQGEPVIGATVRVKGSNIVAITDADGKFQLEAPENADIEVSFIGFAPQVVSNDGAPLDIRLAEDSNLLDEVVVVGYGTQKKVNVVGSIATVDSKQLEGRTGGSLSNMINGYLSGVTITQGSGSPGSDQPTIRVRGVGSFGADPSPLILVDGLPGNMNDLTPAEVESISVLKDAASAAIYGSRAANGVILITTKNGREGKTRVTYNGTVGWSSAVDLPKLAHSYEYAEYYNMALGTESYTPEMIQKFRDGSDPDN